MMLSAELFSRDRYDGGSFASRGTESVISEHRTLKHKATIFQEDIQRIIYSSAFRRLQNKTQVHPLPNSDYLRNRLTHSLEVSEIGQMIAQGVSLELFDRGILPGAVNPYDVKDIVASACLIHDLGNPPFGHNGEEAIQSWFTRHLDHELVSRAFQDEHVKLDMLHFDGNAQTFRVINRLQNWRERGGLKLSVAVIGSSVKYPWSSVEAENRCGKKNKFGYMLKEGKHFKDMFERLGLSTSTGFRRHPLSYIMEAADDIAYLTTDIEDGVKAGSISFDVGIQLLENCCDETHVKEGKKSGLRGDGLLGYLRGCAITNLAENVVETFLLNGNLDSVVGGVFTGDLLSVGSYKKELAAIRAECKANLYNRRDKLLIEAGGHYVIEALMDLYMEMAAEFFRASCNKNPDKLSKKSRNIFYLLPLEVRENGFASESEASMIYRIVDYISGMTDTYAVTTYRKLTGSSLHRI